MRLALALAALALAGCGDEPARDVPATPTPQADRAVTGSVDLETPAGGPPDAGTQGGHRPGAARGETREATFSFDGIVSPAQSEVTVAAAGGGGAEATVRMLGDHGDFTVELSGLAAGRNRFTLRATADGHSPWEQRVVVTRR